MAPDTGAINLSLPTTGRCLAWTMEGPYGARSQDPNGPVGPSAAHPPRPRRNLAWAATPVLPDRGTKTRARTTTKTKTRTKVHRLAIGLSPRRAIVRRFLACGTSLPENSLTR